MYNFFRKYWWAVALVGLLVIFVVLPSLNFGNIMSYYPLAGGERILDQASCVKFENTCKGSSLLIGCAIKDGICKCSTTFITDPAELKIKCGVSSSSVDTFGAQTKPDTVSGTITTTTTAEKLVCTDGKLYKGSALWNDCEGKGCWTQGGVGVCKSGSGFGDFFSKEAIKGVPNYLLVLAGVFILFMFSMAGGRQ